MAQITSYTSPDAVAGQPDMNIGATGEEEPHKKTMFGKIKDKTKRKTRKLKDMLSPKGEGVGHEQQPEEDTSSSSSDEENVLPPEQNAFSGMTQPKYGERLESGLIQQDKKEEVDSGSTGGISVDEFNKRNDSDDSQTNQEVDSGLSSQLQALSTSDKGNQEVDSGLWSEFQALSTSDKDEVQGGVSSEEGVGSKGGVGEQPLDLGKDPVLEKAGNPKADDTAPVEGGHADPEGLLTGLNKAEEPMDAKTGAGKTWGQWIGEKVGYAKDAAGAKLPSTTTPGTTDTSSTAETKPITEKAYETLIQAKEAVVGKASETAEATKPLDEQSREAEGATQPENKSYTQKLTGAIYGVKDSLMTSTQPGEEDKAFSQKVTETVSNLPGTIKSTLGFGAGKTASGGGVSSETTENTSDTTSVTPVPTSAATTPAGGFDVAPGSTEEGAAASPKAPGIVDRVTGTVTSLFGGKKQPTDSSNVETTSISGHPTSEATTGSVESTPQASSQ